MEKSENLKKNTNIIVVGGVKKDPVLGLIRAPSYIDSKATTSIKNASYRKLTGQPQVSLMEKVENLKKCQQDLADVKLLLEDIQTSGEFSDLEILNDH